MPTSSDTYSSCSESEPFALQVLGNDMSPEFPDGCIIVGEPNAVVVDGCYVIAKIAEAFIFRQLRIEKEPEKWVLTALDDTQADIQISGPEAIRARVVQRSTGRKNSRRCYV